MPIMLSGAYPTKPPTHLRCVLPSLTVPFSCALPPAPAASQEYRCSRHPLLLASRRRIRHRHLHRHRWSELHVRVSGWLRADVRALRSCDVGSARGASSRVCGDGSTDGIAECGADSGTNSCSDGCADGITDVGADGSSLQANGRDNHTRCLVQLAYWCELLTERHTHRRR